MVVSLALRKGVAFSVECPEAVRVVGDQKRLRQVALNHGVSGQLDGPSSYLMKSPFRQRHDDVARADTEKFIARYARTAPAAVPAKR